MTENGRKGFDEELSAGCKKRKIKRMVLGINHADTDRASRNGENTSGTTRTRRRTKKKNRRRPRPESGRKDGATKSEGEET